MKFRATSRTKLNFCSQTFPKFDMFVDLQKDYGQDKKLNWEMTKTMFLPGTSLSSIDAILKMQ